MSDLAGAYLAAINPRMTLKLDTLSGKEEKDQEAVFEMCRAVLGLKYAIFAELDKGVIYIGRKLK